MRHDRKHSAFLAVVALAPAGPVIAQAPEADTVLWRTEVREYWSSGRVWPAHRPGDYSRDDGFVVTSLALTM